MDGLRQSPLRLHSRYLLLCPIPLNKQDFEQQMLHLIQSNRYLPNEDPLFSTQFGMQEPDHSHFFW